MSSKARITIKGVEPMIKLMRRTGKRVERFELDIMDKYADKLVDLARRYAPRDFGDLEKAIQKWPDKEAPRNRRVWFVGVNEEKLGAAYQTYGHRYDIYQHERQHKPGQGSIDKGKAIGLPVGGTAWNRIGSKYLDRATLQITKQMNKAVKERLERELQGAGW